MTPQCNSKNLCVCEPERDKRISIKSSIQKKKKKKKTLINKPKLACVLLKIIV